MHPARADTWGGYIMGHTMDLGSTLPPLQICISGSNGEFICIVWGLLFEGTASDLSPVEEVSTWELSNIVIQNPPEDAPRMDCLRKHRKECGAEVPADTFRVDAALHKEESMEWAPQSDLGEKGSESSRVRLLQELPHTTTP